MARSVLRHWHINTTRDFGEIVFLLVNNNWMQKEPSNDLPKIIKAYQLIHQAWEIRGRGTIDTVSNQKQVAFKKNLNQALDLLITVHKSDTAFYPNCVSSLLKIYKAIDVNRDEVHDLFTNAVKNHPGNAELHFNYFAFISPKWGGLEEEMNAYLNQLDNQTAFIQDLILAQYYFDLEYMYDYKDTDKKMEDFMEMVKNKTYDANELYQYELYLLVYWLSSNLGIKGLEKHFKGVLAPYWED